MALQTQDDLDGPLTLAERLAVAQRLVGRLAQRLQVELDLGRARATEIEAARLVLEDELRDAREEARALLLMNEELRRAAELVTAERDDARRALEQCRRELAREHDGT